MGQMGGLQRRRYVVLRVLVCVAAAVWLGCRDMRGVVACVRTPVSERCVVMYSDVVGGQGMERGGR